MLLQALVKYYEILSEDEESDIPKLGYSNVNVSYALNISKDGELLNVIPLKNQKMMLPVRLRKSVDIKSGFLWDTSSYVFGIDKEEVTLRTKKCFDDFKQIHINLLGGIICDEAKALINYVNRWNPEEALENNKIKDIIGTIKNENFIFKLDGGGYIHDNGEIKHEWEKYYEKESSNGEENICLVTGEKSIIARIHPKISGIGGTNPALVSFDKDSNAYCSYGKDGEQGLNSPVSVSSCIKYGLALNYLLSNSKNHIYLGSTKPKLNDKNEYIYDDVKDKRSETTVIFWSEAPHIRLKIEELANNLFSGDFTTDQDCDSYESFETELYQVFRKISHGQPVNFNNLQIWKSTFYVLGISPAKGRAVIKFIFKNTYEYFINKILDHYEDLKIEKSKESEKTIIPLKILLAQTANPKGQNDNAASSLLEGSVMRSILTGTPYPAALYNAVMIRIRAEYDINYYKAAIIKAYLLRCSNKNKYKEVLTVSLNPNSNNKAYVLGRLFAVLEKAQIDASSSGINSTIKDRYFTSACATPATVFPILLRLSSHHISKAEYGLANDNRIKEIMNILDIDNNPFPKNLSLEEQGVFILGYYHQKNTFYKKEEDK